MNNLEKILIYIFCIIITVIIFFIRIKNNLTKLLYEVCCAFNEENIDYWVDFGSLLGIIREGKPIMFDRDIDISVINFNQDQINRLAKNFEKRNIHFIREYKKIYRCRLNNFFMMTNKKFGYADIYVNSIDFKNKKYISPTGEKCDIPMDLIGKPQIYKWKDIYIKVPEKIHETLVYRYGDDYMTPRPFYKGRDN